MIPMKTYASMTREELLREYAAQQNAYDRCKEKNLALNMARGKPAKAQLDLCKDILTVISKPEDCLTAASMPATTASWPVCLVPAAIGRMFWAVNRSRPL